MEMREAYNVKELGAKLKAKGLANAEDLAEDVIKEFLDWLKESAVKSKTPYDDILIAVIPQIEKFALEAADDIDKSDNA